MTDTWVPRGTETAYLLYDAPGWVGFSNLNTFGFTGYEFSHTNTWIGAYGTY